MKKYTLIWICCTAACLSNMYLFAQNKNHDGFVNLGVGVAIPYFNITGVKLNMGMSYNLNIAHPIYKNLGIIMSLNGATHAISDTALFLAGYQRNSEKAIIDNYNYYGYLGGIYVKGSIEQLHGYLKFQYGHHYSDLPKYEVSQTGNYGSGKYSYSSKTEGGESSGSTVVIGGGVYLTMNKKFSVHIDISWLQSKHAYKDVYIYTSSTLRNSNGYMVVGQNNFRSKFDVDITSVMFNFGVSYALNFAKKSPN